VNPRIFRLICVSILFFLPAAAWSQAHDWPQWRGPNHDGISTEKGWSPKRKAELWYAFVGTGYAAVSIVGDNLYTESVVALDADTGKLKWHFQFTPHDIFDFDSNQVPILVDHDLDGQPRKLILWGNRNAFFYLLDRVTGEYLGSTQFAKQTWATEIDEHGRPIPVPDAVPSLKGTLVWPGASGATNWPPPSFNPDTGLFYVTTSDRASIFYKGEVLEERVPGDPWFGSTSTAAPGSLDTSIVAIDPFEPKVVWKRSLSGDDAHGRFSGTLSTPELLFVGESTKLFALDAVSGENLWNVELGDVIGSPPVSYAIDGIQFLTVAAGPNIFTFGVATADR